MKTMTFECNSLRDAIRLGTAFKQWGAPEVLAKRKKVTVICPEEQAEELRKQGDELLASMQPAKKES